MAEGKNLAADNSKANKQYKYSGHVHMQHLTVEEFATLRSAEQKLFWRVLVLNIALMFVNYIDRTNLSFASVQLNPELGLDDTTYGLGAGLFFATYAGMQIPANMMMTKIGGPIWLGTIALCWGVTAACFATIKTIPHYFALRCLLGFFEAGALPGMWSYLSHFYSKQRITIPMGYLMGSLIVSQVLGPPLAAGLMALDGRGGLQGWQWLFLIEGLLACVVAVFWFFMPRDIDGVKGLTQEERMALHAAMSHQAKPVSSAWQGLLGAVKNPAVWIGGLGIKFFRDVGFYGLMYWLPLVVKSMLPATPNRNTYAILLTAVPFLCTAIVQIGSSMHSQKTNERRYHLTSFWAVGVVCLALLPVAQMHGSASGSFILLTVGVVGVFGVEGISISYYLALMGGEKGLGIAVINMLGAFGGFVGPYVIGALTQTTGKYYAAMWLMAGCVLVAAVNAALVSEEWAMQFSLKPGDHHHDAVHRMHSNQQHGIMPSVCGDATVAAEMVACMEQSDPSSDNEGIAAGGNEQDIELGKDSVAGPAAR